MLRTHNPDQHYKYVDSHHCLLPHRSTPLALEKSTSQKIYIGTGSVVDPDPYWIRIQELPGSTHANIG